MWEVHTPAVENLRGFLGVGKVRLFCFALSVTVVALTRHSRNMATKRSCVRFLLRTRPIYVKFKVFSCFDNVKRQRGRCHAVKHPHRSSTTSGTGQTGVQRARGQAWTRREEPRHLYPQNVARLRERGLPQQLASPQQHQLAKRQHT
jgi:hypothetical protein